MKNLVLPHRSIVSAGRSSAATASIGLIGGVALQTVTNQLFVIVPLLLALPAINAMTADYATVVAAHIGDPEITKGGLKKLFKALLLSLTISAVGVTVISLYISYLQDYQMDQNFVITYTVFVFVSLFLVVGITVGSSFALNRFLIRHRLNSDDVLIPVSTVIASVLILLSVAFAAWRIF